MRRLFLLLFAAQISLAVLAAPVAAQERGPAAALAAADSAVVVDLSGEEHSSLQEGEARAHVLVRPWYQKVEVSGFGAFWFIKSGRDGTRPKAGFVIKETTLFVEAETWEDAALFFEIQTNVLQRDEKKGNPPSVRTGEVYAHFRNVLQRWGDGLLGIKVGRVDIPFGEEYLWQDAPDNVLISNSAAYPWLWDEGLVLYGKLRGVGWLAAVMDGTAPRQEDDAEKAVVAKVHGRPWKPLYLSASFMKNGDTAKSALLLGGSFFQPVGAGLRDIDQLIEQNRASPSTKIDATLYQADVQWTPADGARLDLFFGRALIDDRQDAFDRNLSWFALQASCDLGRHFYAAGRYSEIGTYDDDEGYRIGGEFLANGKAFDYDAKRLQRLSAGLGWKLNPRAKVKLEVGRDLFEVIDASPLDPSDDERAFYAVELAVSF